MLQARPLAERLFSRGVRWPGHDIPDAVDWLLRLLTTRKTMCLFKAAIWGLTIDQDIALTDTSRLMRFNEFPDLYVKGRILNRARRRYDESIWMSQTYYDAPSIGFIQEVDEFPYIGTDGACFRKMNDLVRQAHELWVLVQASTVGPPLAVACWFEYADHDLEYSEWEIMPTWLLPEVPPHVKHCSAADVKAIKTNYINYFALDRNWRSTLLRSMERFRQSQCRRETIDRVLDLALALEIAVSEKGDNAPPGWKVSVRTAQLIGGSLHKRQENREIISDLYDLRNKATHGGKPEAKSKAKSVEGIIHENCRLYVQLMKKLLALRKKPDWKAVELETAVAGLTELVNVESGGQVSGMSERG